jgi:hypothetical protein
MPRAANKCLAPARKDSRHGDGHHLEVRQIPLQKNKKGSPKAAFLNSGWKLNPSA